MTAKRLFLRLCEASAILCVAALGVLYAMSRASSTGFLVSVEDHHVALLVDNRSGDVRVDDTPGFHVLAPWLQDAYRLDKSAIEYVMEGEQRVNDNLVPRLEVRAADGAPYWFENVRIQYAIRPEAAWQVVRDAGADYAWHYGTLDAFARGILAEELGRHTAEEIVRAEVLRDATLRAKTRLGEALARRGLVVHEVLTSKPAFPKEYEAIVQRRKVAEREMETIAQSLAQLRASREDRRAKLERDRTLSEALLRDQLTKNRAKAERDAERARVEAENAYRAKVRQGELRQAELLSQADSATVRYTNEAAAFRARAEAVAAQGELAVLKTLIANLAKTEIIVEPFESAEQRARRTAGL